MKWSELWKKRKQIISDNGISEDRYPDDQAEEQDDQTIGMPTGETQKDEKTLIGYCDINFKKFQLKKSRGQILEHKEPL